MYIYTLFFLSSTNRNDSIEHICQCMVYDRGLTWRRQGRVSSLCGPSLWSCWHVARCPSLTAAYWRTVPPLHHQWGFGTCKITHHILYIMCLDLLYLIMQHINYTWVCNIQESIRPDYHYLSLKVPVAYTFWTSPFWISQKTIVPSVHPVISVSSVYMVNEDTSWELRM